MLRLSRSNLIIKTPQLVKKKRKRKIYYKNLVFLTAVILILQISIFENHEFENHASLDSVNSQPLSSNIIGEDDRIRVTYTTVYPWSTIVKLYMTWGEDVYIGSGTMIDKKHVLTAGHCVYAHSLGGWADSVKVIPGANNGNEPFGHAWANNMRCYSDWIVEGYLNHDFAVLTLDRDIGLQTGWMELFTTVPWSSIYFGGFNTVGYPGDLDYGLNMYKTTDKGGGPSEFFHDHFL